jgi:sigma-B regulation protein RsbU (phosphoserine phosphatase)
LIRRIINYEILGIFVYRPETEIMELKVAIGYAEETVQQCRALPLGRGLLGHACRERKTILSTDLAHDTRVIRAKTADGRWTQSEIAVPIISRDRLLGGIVVESTNPRFFKAEQVQILETLASQMAVSIDNAQLFQQLLTKEQKLEADFALARDLQSSMLPLSMPVTRDLDLAAIYRPAESLGGDYYDFLWLDGDNLGLAIGDVSGKGVAAAMTMAAARSALRFAARVNSSPSQVLYHVNRRLYRDVKKRTYVSLFYGVLDVKTRWFRWSNGGHFAPILIHTDGRMEVLSKGGTVLALFDKSRYSASQTRLSPGDVLCFYTDGVIETWNQAEEEFGRQRLVDVLVQKGNQPAKEILKALAGELKKFAHGAGQHDDITAFILKVPG